MANPNIYNALIQPMRSVGDYEDQMAARKMGMQRNALLEMQMQQQQQALQRQQAVGGVFQKYGMSPDTANELLKLGAVDEAQQVQKALVEQASQQAAMQQQQARQAYMRSLQPTQAIDANRASGVTGPRPEALGVVGQRAKFDPAQALQVMSVEEATKLQGLIDPRAEVKDYQQVRMPDGSVRVVGLTKDGQVIQTGQTPFVKPEFQRFGNYVGAVDPVSLKTQNVGGINMSAAEAAQDARARQGLAMQRERMNFDRGQAVADSGGPGQMALIKQFGKPSPHHRWKPDGTLEAIPGGPADPNAGEAGAKREAQKTFNQAQASAVIDTVRDAKKLVGWTTTGPGALAASLPATNARDLRAKLETVKANLGFDRLQQMRDMSPTGGALGAIAVQELIALQSTVASLDQAQSPGEVGKALDKIERHYKRWADTMQSGAAKPAPGAPQVVDFGSLK